MDFADLDKSDEQKLIERCIKKDKRSWDIFVGRYSKLVLWAIRDRLSRFRYNFNDDDVEDIHQEVFVSLWAANKLEQVKDKSKVAGWIAMVAGNAAIDYFKKTKRQMPPRTISIFEEIYSSTEGKAKTLEELLPAHIGNPNRELHLSEIRIILDAALEALTPKEKTIITLNLLYGRKHREIAEILKLSINTVSTIIVRTKEELKEKLRQKGIEDF
ncbi:MAG: hypothetical protein AMJ78_02530 [Omnitrophica WOR_2 bacterium SM23_29]|nr:MAG: hypothetical protein AMJ78_02530 [Omnitrophica WOR_2 bacterium SM23_29]